MIEIRETIETDYRKEKYVATISLKGTLAEDFAPYGTKVESPHVKGYGSTPEAALKECYVILGQKAVYTLKVPND